MAILVPSYRASGALNDQSALIPSATETSEGVVSLSQVLQGVNNTFYGTGAQGDLVNPVSPQAVPYFANNFTLESGHTLRPTFFQFNVLGTFSLNGVLDLNGAPGVGINGALPTPGFNLLSSGSGGNGGAGSVNNGANGFGNGADFILSGPTGNGGVGGNGNATTGGSVGTVGNQVQILDNYPWPGTNDLILAFVIKCLSGSGGCGGGGGGGDGAAAAGGDGGGGGESGLYGFIRARRFVLGPTGQILLRGGAGANGGAGALGGGATGGGGGGSGGGGGHLYIFCNEFVNQGGLIDASGGAGGTGGVGRNGGTNGAPGASGQDGQIEVINMLSNTRTALP